MSNYSITTNFTTKDALASGDPAKKIKGTEFGTEFSAIATAVNSKADLASPALTGTPTAPTASSGTDTTQIATTAFVKAAVDTSAATKLSLSGGTMTGNVLLKTTTMTRVDMSSATAIDQAEGNYFTKTIAANTTFTITNVPTGTIASGFILELTNGGAYTVTFPASVKWAGGTAPTLTASGVDVLVFITDDAGTTWRGVASMLDSK
mgnify:FL=1